jgi:hypothetical protein
MPKDAFFDDCRDGGLIIQRRMVVGLRNIRMFNLSEADIAQRDLMVGEQCAGLQLTPDTPQLIGRAHMSVFPVSAMVRKRLWERFVMQPVLPCHSSLQVQPLALQKLAAFLHEAHFQDKKRDRPVVVIGPKSVDSRCLVVGFAGNPRSGTVRLFDPSLLDNDIGSCSL